MDRCCARAWIAPVRVTARYVAAGDGRDALVMITSASEVPIGAAAGCRVDEPVCGATSSRFRTSFGSTVSADRAPVARQSRSGRHPRVESCGPGDRRGRRWGGRPSEPS